MEALKFAFDTIIAGVLALPWIALVIALYLDANPGKWTDLKDLFDDRGNKLPAAAASILLFSVTYFLGAAVSRASANFFNDEHLPLSDRIRVAVYCNPDEAPFLKGTPAALHVSNPDTVAKDLTNACAQGGSSPLIQQIFHQQENALLPHGTDKTTPLDQLRSQISVLQGATFNSLVTLVLCVFGCGAKRAQVADFRFLPSVPPGSHRSPARWVQVAAAGAALLLCVFGIFGFAQHLLRRDWSRPPFMDFTTLLLGVTGGFALRGGSKSRPYFCWLLAAGFLVIIGFFGWWWSEVLYDQQVLHSARAIFTP
jgi:4-amino-4-deoxy-L-arabinose transferase-like glycosyltransferase